jgi:hypothetical protein
MFHKLYGKDKLPMGFESKIQQQGDASMKSPSGQGPTRKDTFRRLAEEQNRQRALEQDPTEQSQGDTSASQNTPEISKSDRRRIERRGDKRWDDMTPKEQQEALERLRKEKDQAR